MDFWGRSIQIPFIVKKKKFIEKFAAKDKIKIKKIGKVFGNSLDFINHFEISVKKLISINNKWFNNFLKMTLSPEQIVEMIKRNLPDAEVEIEDLRGDNNHYHAKIKSKSFKGLSKIKQHQLVYKALGTHMGSTLHALMLTTKEI